MLTMSSLPGRSLIMAAVVMGAALSSSSQTSARLLSIPSDVAVDGRAGAILDAYAHLPIAFVENRGQTDRRVRYYAVGSRYSFYLTQNAIVLSFLNESAASELALSLQFLGSNPSAVIYGEKRAAGDVNYFHGNDATEWRTNVPRYSQVVYRDLWEGVDLRLREERGTLKYEFLVRAGARPADIRFGDAGPTGLSLDASGALRSDAAMGPLRDSSPVSQQMIDGARVPVESRYTLIKSANGRLEYGFDIGEGYRSDRDLIIDPGIEYSTFLGGSS